MTVSTKPRFVALALLSISVLATACSSGDDSDPKSLSTDAPAVTEAPTSDDPTTSAAPPLDSSRCEYFDLDDANAILTTDEGNRTVPGDIVTAVRVTSSESVADDAPANAGRQIEFIAINVDDQIVILAHAVDGLWSSVDQFSETATGFPLGNEWLLASIDTDGAVEAVRCAEAAFTPTTTAPASGFDLEAWRAEAIERFGPEEVYDDGSKDDYVDLAYMICDQTGEERANMLDNLGDDYEGSRTQFILEEFCPNV